MRIVQSRGAIYSKYIGIPPEFLEALGIDTGDEMVLNLRDDVVEIRKRGKDDAV